MRVTVRPPAIGDFAPRPLFANGRRSTSPPPAALGSRIALRFTGLGLTEVIPEMRGGARSGGCPMARSSSTARRDGLPINVQIVGSWLAQSTILNVALLLEGVSPVRGLHPDL